MELVQLWKNQKKLVIPSKWAFKRKKGIGVRDRYKARLVAKGFAQTW
jgi:hypothetical protein